VGCYGPKRFYYRHDDRSLVSNIQHFDQLLRLSRLQQLSLADTCRCLYICMVCAIRSTDYTSLGRFRVDRHEFLTVYSVHVEFDSRDQAPNPRRTAPNQQAEVPAGVLVVHFVVFVQLDNALPRILRRSNWRISDALTCLYVGSANRGAAETKLTISGDCGVLSALHLTLRTSKWVGHKTCTWNRFDFDAVRTIPNTFRDRKQDQSLVWTWVAAHNHVARPHADGLRLLLHLELRGAVGCGQAGTEDSRSCFVSKLAGHWLHSLYFYVLGDARCPCLAQNLQEKVLGTFVSFVWHLHD